MRAIGLGMWMEEVLDVEKKATCSGAILTMVIPNSSRPIGIGG